MGDRPAHPYLLSRPPVSKKTHIGKNHRMVPLDKWKVTVKYVYHFSLLPGAKISNFHGNKGVVVRVAPDHEMPVDDFGNRADLIFPPNSPISRLNSGQLIEQYINAISRGVRNDMLQMMAQGDVEGAWQHYIQYIQLVSDYHYQHIDPENTEERDEILERIKKEPLVVILPAGTGKFDMDRATRLLQFRAPDISPVTYIDEQGKTVRTKSPVLIAPERIMTLDKSEHKPMATAGVTRQIHGFPAVENDSTKYTKPTTEKTTRVLGEGEVRAVAAVTKEGIRYTMALTNSPKGHKEVCRNIFNADNPLQIDEVLPHSETYGNRAVELIRHIGQCAGFDIEYKKLEE
jgi:DNA-directed RNA polymerase beta subunit